MKQACSTPICRRRCTYLQPFVGLVKDELQVSDLQRACEFGRVREINFSQVIS